MALRIQNVEEWKHYLNEIGIPDPYAGEYAATFSKHQVPRSLLGLLSDDDLGDKYGIELYGHRLLIRHNNAVTQATQVTPSSSYARRHHAPQLQPSMSPSDFRSFCMHWTVYKTLVGMAPNAPDAAAQLFSLACNDHPELRRTIADHKADHILLTETEYLNMLKKLLTAQATPETYRNKFFNMVQNTGESCHQWLKRLKEVVPDCEFNTKCHQHKDEAVVVNFDNSLLRSKFILGMNNDNIKQDLLTKSLELTTLDQVFNHATRMEATSREMNINQKVVAGIKLESEPSSSSEEEEIGKLSSYRKMRKPQKPPRKLQQSKKCIGCGSNQHSSLERSAKCPAWDRNCRSCGKRGHLSKVCRGEKPTDCANALLASMSAESKISNNQIEAQITALINPKKKTTTKVMVLPDTGATLCVVGPHMLKLLGVKLAQLQPTDRDIVTATGSEIKCKGKLPIEISIGSCSTKLDLFICENIGRFYLSKSGCIQLGIIHKDFPKPLNTDIPPSPGPLASMPLPKRPSKIPFDPVPQNVPKLKEYLVKAFGKTAFSSDKTKVFPKMTGPKAHIHLMPDAKPFFRGTPNQLPHYWRGGTKKLIDEFVRRRLIAKTKIGTPTPWCHPMVITAKKSNTLNPKLRMTTDLQNLNRQCIRELHHVEAPFHLASQIPRNTFKTILDAVDGYQAVELDEESQQLTNFITHWGTYHWLRVPAGLVDSGDKYTSRYDAIIQNVPRKVKCVDDTLLYDTTIEEAFYHTFDYLITCASNGIVLNASKFQFCEKEVNFAGFRITPTGIKPSEATLKAISEFPTPQNITDVRSWFGLVRQVAYAHSVSDDLAPFRDLLKHNGGKQPTFFWTPELQRLFEISKKHLVDSVVKGIETFDSERWTCLQCDWSKQGIGFLLLQKHCNCPEPPPSTQTSSDMCCNTGWKLVYAGSRFTNSAESRYAPTEGEALAVAWALRTARMYTLGCPKLLIVTDHKPLLGIFNDRDLGSIRNPRIRRIKEQTLEYRFHIQHCPGKLHLGADALSRHPTSQPLDSTKLTEEIANMFEQETESMLQQIIADISLADETGSSQFSSAITLDKVKLECVKDSDYQQLHNLVTSGFPERRNDTPNSCKTYWAEAQKGALSTYENVVLYHDRLVIPKSLRTMIVQVLHAAHQGCNGMIARASKTVYWPGIRKDILNHQTNCRSCLENSPSHPREPLQMTPIPDRPFQIVCTDLFQLKGRHYLVIVDRFSGFMHVYHSREPPTHKFLIRNIRDVFMRYGRPDQLESDGGPQYKSYEFQKFLEKWGVKHRVSSPYYAQSNGRAELAVKSAKRMLEGNIGNNGELENDKVARAVLQYHNTPLSDGVLSPAQLLFGRPLADFLPVNPRSYQLHPYWRREINKHQTSRAKHHTELATRYNRGTRNLPPLSTGQTVSLQSPTTKRWNRTGSITEKLPHRRYKIRLHDNGNTTIRNRRFLKPYTTSRNISYWSPSGPSIRPMPAVALQHTQIENNTPAASVPEAPHSVGEGVRSQPRPKEPLALRRLRPHNQPGLAES